MVGGKVGASLLQVLALFVVLITVFSHTVGERRAASGVLSYGHHEWLTAHALKFERIWWREGALKLDLLMMEVPEDIEHPSLSQRQIYPSYPPGAALAHYVVAKVSGVEPTVASLMDFNRALHLFIASCLSIVTWLWLRKDVWWLRLLLAAVPGISYLLLPGPMFWQQNVYFTDTAAIGPFALLLVALAVGLSGHRSWSELMLCGALFWGFMTDWFFVSVALVLVAARFVAVMISGPEEVGRLRHFLRQLAPVVVSFGIAFGFYAWQLTRHDLWGHWRGKLMLRTYGTGDGADSLSSDFARVFWDDFVQHQYGSVGVWLCWLTAILSAAVLIKTVAAYRSRKVPTDDSSSPERASLIAVAALSPLLHTYLLKNHSFLHDFSALKFAVPLSLVSFVLLPDVLIQHWPEARNRRGMAVAALAACLGLSYVLSIHGRYADMTPPRNPEIAKLGLFVEGNTGYSDVVFSRFTKAEPYPSEPHLLAHTLKLIHQVTTMDQLAEHVRALPAGAKVVWLGEAADHDAPPGGASLWESAERVSDGSFVLLRLSRERFLTWLVEDGVRPGVR